MTTPVPCKVCGRKPDIDECGGNSGWYACCYKKTPHEHCEAVNCWTKDETITAWNRKQSEPKEPPHE